MSLMPLFSAEEAVVASGQEEFVLRITPGTDPRLAGVQTIVFGRTRISLILPSTIKIARGSTTPEM